MLIFGRQGDEKAEIIENTDSTGSGFLEIEIFPGGGDIFIDNVHSGKSPTTLYNIPIGSYNVVVKKDGYEDFSKEVDVEAGRKTFVEGRLALMQVIEEQVTDIMDGDVEAIGIIEEVIEEEETLTEASENNTINIGSKFLLYYDFIDGKFEDKRNFEQDVFSKRFEKYLVFTRLYPVNIKTVGKGIDEIVKEDCLGIRGEFENLFSEESLCVITKENDIFAVGGYWENTENAELTYKLFS